MISSEKEKARAIALAFFLTIAREAAMPLEAPFTFRLRIYPAGCSIHPQPCQGCDDISSRDPG